MRLFAILLIAIIHTGTMDSFLIANPAMLESTGGMTAEFSSEIPVQAIITRLSEGSTSIAVWNEEGNSYFAVKREGRDWQVVGPTSYELQLKYAKFDPVAGEPAVAELLKSRLPGDAVADDVVDPEHQIYIVQFATQPLQEYRDAIEVSGGVIYKFLAHHSYLVRLDAKAYEAVKGLPYVRWVGAYHPAYKLEAELLAAVAPREQVNNDPAPTRVNIMVFERGLRQKEIVSDQIVAIGGKVDLLIPNGYRLEATLSSDQLVEVARMPEVIWIDHWSEPEFDMNNAREIGGANFLETVEGYTGQGVRGEVFDSNLFSAHVDFQNIPPIFHGNHTGADDHGTGTYGVVFGDGTGDFQGRGMLPDAQGIFADNGQFTNRYTHTAELLESPYNAVFQSNSWGNAVTTQYNSISAEIDDIIFLNDILITQSQSNQDSILSRPQAWAKNIVSVGGIRHSDTLTKNDDFWSGASIGPAADGRIKPDLSHFYDSIYTTDDTVNGYRNFGGTSGATPIVAGHFGLFFQMWSEGIFGNTVDSEATVFENRPHATTAKAMLINHACSYPFSGVDDNLTRTHQGWGLPDLARLHDFRNDLFIVNEEVVLNNLDSAQFELDVEAGTPEFRATLVYMDLMGTTSSSQHRINDLSLQVVSPDGISYWGNNGLMAANWSTAGGSANIVDTVENVLVQNPAAGTWTVTVVASEINEDAHVETPGIDADFALIVSGIFSIDSTLDSLEVLAGQQIQGKIEDLTLSNDQYVKVVADSSLPVSDTPVQIELLATLANINPSNMVVSVESNANTFGLSKSIQLFNINTKVFEDVVSQTESFGDDEVTSIDISKTIEDFVAPGTGQVRLRVGWIPTGPVLLYPWTISIDQISIDTN